MVTARYRVKKGFLTSLDFSSPRELRTSSGSEQLLHQETMDFDLLDASIASISAKLSALTKQVIGPGTYFVRVGGTYNLADGVIFATMVTTHGAGYLSLPDTTAGAVLPKPTGSMLVKITGASSSPGILAFIKAFEVVFS